MSWFAKSRGIPRLAERSIASQKGLRFVELLTFTGRKKNVRTLILHLISKIISKISFHNVMKIVKKKSNTHFYFHVFSDYEAIVSPVTSRSGHATQHSGTTISFCFTFHFACDPQPCSIYRWLHYILIPKA